MADDTSKLTKLTLARTARRIALCATLALGLLVAEVPTTASAATVAAPVSVAGGKRTGRATKMRVHVVGPAGHSVGHARLSIRRVAAKKPHLSKTTNGHGNYTSGSLPAGSYVVLARRHGFRSTTGSMALTAGGTHRMTIRLGKAASVYAARVVHARSAHALGTKAAVKKPAPSRNPNVESKRPAAHNPLPRPTAARPQ